LPSSSEARCFGELALLDGGERLADVTMTTAGEVLEVGQAGFTTLLDESTEASRAVMTQLATRLRESERQRFA
jgi:CRP-like cAMP-binding protein